MRPLLKHILFLFFFAPQLVFAQTHAAQICTGYLADRDSWGEVGISVGTPDGSDSDFCPKNHGFIAVENDSGDKREGKYIGVLGACCPLPATDILMDKHILVTSACPANHIATGVIPSRDLSEKSLLMQGANGKNYWMYTEKRMRCTKINSKRYQLGESLPSYRWGWHKHFSTLRERWTTRVSIPVAIRHSAGRKDRKTWSGDGCIGYPWGSLLVRKESKYCRGFFFSQLQYTGMQGDPPKGTAVKMFPDCSSIDNPLNKNAKCVK